MWDVESATGKGVLYVGHSKNETSKREIPLNGARGLHAMLNRGDKLGHHGARAITSGARASTTTTTPPKPAESERPQHGSRTAMLTGSKRPVANTMFSEVPPNEAIHPRF